MLQQSSDQEAGNHSLVHPRPAFVVGVGGAAGVAVQVQAAVAVVAVDLVAVVGAHPKSLSKQGRGKNQQCH